MSSGNVTSPHRPALAPLDANTPRVGKAAKPTFVKHCTGSLSAALHRKSTSSLYDDSEEAVTVEKERRSASATSFVPTGATLSTSASADGAARMKTKGSRTWALSAARGRLWAGTTAAPQPLGAT